MGDLYAFVIERIDHSRLVIGRGTLEEGIVLIERIEAGSCIPDGWEGCNIVAMQDGVDKFVYIDQWEELKDK